VENSMKRFVWRSWSCYYYVRGYSNIYSSDRAL